MPDNVTADTKNIDQKLNEFKRDILSIIDSKIEALKDLINGQISNQQSEMNNLKQDVSVLNNRLDSKIFDTLDIDTRLQELEEFKEYPTIMVDDLY